MSINDPILEMLSFALENEVNLTSAPDGSGASSEQPAMITSSTGSAKSESSTANSIDFTPSSVLLGNDGNLPCLFPSCPWQLTSCDIKCDKQMEEELLKHFLSEHKFVVDKIEEIANWRKYLSHWREELKKCSIKDICVGFVMGEGPKPEMKRKEGSAVPESANPANCDIKGESPDPDKNLYFMLSPALPEDSQLRKKLWKERLDIVLEANRQEREDNNFCRRCLFCHEVVTGNRTIYFNHMREKHSFHIGQPDNLVFIKELLHVIEEKLNRLECLFCEHIYKDKAVLKEHMRKKQHRQLNPKNRVYDRFYIVNYLEPGANWETIQHEDYEDERKEEEWVEPVEEKERQNIVCLFCKAADSDFQTLLDHMRTSHGFNFLAMTDNLDFYQKIKLVNFVRRTVYQHSCFSCEKRFQDNPDLLEHIKEHTFDDFKKLLLKADQWNQPEYFFPTYENDDFLTCLDNDERAGDDDTAISSEDESKVIPEDLPHVEINNREFDLAGFAIRFHNNQKFN